MPAGVGDLVDCGLIQALDGKAVGILAGYDASTLYRVSTSYSTHVLYGLEDIEVNWETPIDELAILKGELVERESGKRVFIVRARNALLYGMDDTSMDISVRLYGALRGAEVSE